MNPSLSPERVRAELDQLAGTLAAMRAPDALGRIAALADLLTRTVAAGGTVFLCGNGGSAADCQHWAGEMIGRFLTERAAIPFAALTTDSSILTAIANDASIETAFSRQVEALGRPGDALVCISTSGSSPNVLAAAAAARRRSMKVAALTGMAPNPLAAAADVAVDVPSPATPRVQEIHAFIIHAVCGIVEAAVAGRED